MASSGWSLRSCLHSAPTTIRSAFIPFFLWPHQTRAFLGRNAIFFPQASSFSCRVISKFACFNSIVALSPIVAGRWTSHTAVSRLRAQGNGTESTTIRNVAVQVAHELLNAGHRYLDVRTLEEFAAGHIEGAINIPYMFKAGSGMTKNLNFVEEVSAHFDKDDEIVVGCQSGKRSSMAVAELFASDFTGVANVVGGYGAWVQSGLPVV